MITQISGNTILIKLYFELVKDNAHQMEKRKRVVIIGAFQTTVASLLSPWQIIVFPALISVYRALSKHFSWIPFLNLRLNFHELSSKQREMNHLGQLKKNSKFFLLSIARKNKLSFLYPIITFDYRRIVKKAEALLSDLAVTYYVLYKKFFYTRLALLFNLQKDFFLRLQ